MLVVYPDVAFVLNGGLDFLVLCCTMRLMGLPLRMKRLAVAAGIGGLYGALAILPGWQLLQLVLVKGIVALLMVRLSYGKGTLFLRCYMLFLLTSCTLSGAVTAMAAVFASTDQIWLVFLLSALFCAFSIGVIFWRGAQAAVEGKLIPATVVLGKESVRVTLFHDTGNTLRDPESGKVVCVIERKALETLLTAENIVYREIPFQSLGQKEGKITCFTCDAIVVDGMHYLNYPIGIAEFPLTDGGGFVGLWGGATGEERQYDRKAAENLT